MATDTTSPLRFAGDPSVLAASKTPFSLRITCHTKSFYILIQWVERCSVPLPFHRNHDLSVRPRVSRRYHVLGKCFSWNLVRLRGLDHRMGSCWSRAPGRWVLECVSRSHPHLFSPLNDFLEPVWRVRASIFSQDGNFALHEETAAVGLSAPALEREHS